LAQTWTKPAGAGISWNRYIRNGPETEPFLMLTSTPGFHSLCDWCFQTMWLFPGTPEDPEGNTVMEKHGAKALYSAGKSLMHAIRTNDKHAQEDAAHRMIQIAKPWTIRRW